MKEIRHPGQYLIQEIRNRDWTQKKFAILSGKKVSEVNELIKGKRNITIQWDIILSNVLGFPERYFLNKQIDYDYAVAKKDFDMSKIKKQVTKTPSKSAKQQKIKPKKLDKAKDYDKNEGIFKYF